MEKENNLGDKEPGLSRRGFDIGTGAAERANLGVD
jgi:hypothetical protein